MPPAMSTAQSCSHHRSAVFSLTKRLRHLYLVSPEYAGSDKWAGSMEMSTILMRPLSSRCLTSAWAHSWTAVA